MNPDHGGVDHLDAPVISLCNGVHNSIPHAGFAPAVEAIVDGRVRAITFGKIAPGHARAQREEDAVQHPPVVNPGVAPRLVGQKRSDRPPLEFRQVEPTHSEAPVLVLESRSASEVNPSPGVYGYRI